MIPCIKEKKKTKNLKASHFYCCWEEEAATLPVLVRHHF